MKSEGGYLLPNEACVDRARPGVMSSVLRYVGERIIRLGAFVRSLGYKKHKIHPQADFLRMVGKQ